MFALPLLPASPARGPLTSLQEEGSGLLPPWLDEPGWVLPLVLFGSVLVALVATRPLVARFDATGSGFGAPLRALRNVVLPSLAVLLWVMLGLELPGQHIVVRITATLFWVSLLHTLLSLLNALVFGLNSGSRIRRLPKLFRDLLRFFLVLIGGAVVASEVWQTDLTGWITALGVGSLVLGLALQETLGNLFSGVALIFERPVSPGDWLKVGTVEGEVVEMNWRAIRLKTRARDEVVVPNSVLGREIFSNFNLPTAIHREELFIGFSYDDPPNKAKRILVQCAEATEGILDEPAPAVRTHDYGDFAITYQLQLAVRDFEALPDILDRFRTRVWYAARRNGLTIPFPIRTVYKSELPAARSTDRTEERFHELRRVLLFAGLEDEEVRSLAREAREGSFGVNELVIRQGEAGQALHVIRSGEVAVEVRNEHGRTQEVARLSGGDFFGEMGLLTGEARTADVRATCDLELLSIYPEDLRPLLELRPEVAEALAQQIEQRGQDLDAAREANAAAGAAGGTSEVADTGLLERIKYFLGV